MNDLDELSNFPKLDFELVGEDGNAWAILSRVDRAARRRWTTAQRNTWRKAAMAGDYDHLLRAAMAVQSQ